jgi:peroxiredoxin
VCSFAKDYDEFGSRNVEVLPISVDAVPSLKEFRARYEVQNQMLSDFKREVSAAYGVLNAEKFYSNRAYFLIDKQGIVRWAHVESQNGQRRENSEILERVASLD